MRRNVELEERLFRAFALALVVAAGASFWLPALARMPHGLWPAPLDDVYIHFDFARSAAHLHPFEWTAGGGYSSGDTSLVYPLLLAPAFWIGLGGARLGVFAAALACAALFDLARSVRALLRGAPRWTAWAAAALLLAVPLLDWSFYSGMESAVLGAVLGRALVAAQAAIEAPATTRRRAQLRAAVWAALLVATRPETAPFALLLAVAVTHGARSLSALGSLARAGGPVVAFLGAQAATNLALTGEIGAAGAVRKLLSSNPYASRLEIAADIVKNLAALRAQALDAALGGRFAWIVPALGLFAALDRRTRRLALPLLLGAAAALGLVSLNATARFQNLRYAAPTLAMLLVAAALGAGALARRGRVLGVVAAVALAVAIAAPARGFAKQRELFAQASKNVAEQQVEVGRRLAARVPRPRRVFVGDAGAIPYVSGLPALDGLGLGGYRGLPFARASVHGVPAVLELIERLPEAERPDVLAVYPSWWPGLAGEFGPRIDAVAIEGNVMCGAAEKVVYAADWSTLEPPGARREGELDALDVADLVDERAHGYAFPTPHGGWVIGATLRDEHGARRFDAGRIIPAGQAERFTVARGVPRGPARLALRTDAGGPGRLTIQLRREGGPSVARELSLPEHSGDAWFEVVTVLDDVGGGDEIRVLAASGAWRSYHTWLLRPVAQVAGGTDRAAAASGRR